MADRESTQRIKKSDRIAIKWMYSVCKNERGKVLLLIFLNVINAVLTIVYANFSKKIINAAAVDKSIELVIRYAIYYLLIILFQLFLTLLSRSTLERCVAKVEWELKQHMLETILKKDYAQVTKYHTGELQNRMFNDVTIISNGITNIIPDIVLFVTRLVCAFAYLVVIDKVFAFVFLIGGIGVFFCTRFFRKTLKRLHKDVQRTEGKTRSFIQEAVTSLLVVKAFSVEDKILEESNKLQNENFIAKMKRRYFGIVANAGIGLVFNCGYIFALAFGAYRLINGLDYGTVTAMLQLVSQIQNPFAKLSAIMPQYFSVIASAERLMEIEALPDEVSDNQKGIDVKKTYDSMQSINFDNITFSYGRDTVLENTSLKIKKGDFVAIMGISGIGKSTLLKLLLGVFKVQSGSIYLECGGNKIPVDYHTRRLFSYVPQGNFIMSGTIRESLTLINTNASDEEINEAIRISCADEFINELPEGLNTKIGERGTGLSEGQLQRLAIARSLLSESPVMLLDEATSALDERTEHRFLTNLKEMKNKTCIIVSHKRAALEICNKHVQIIDSKIEAEDK